MPTITLSHSALNQAIGKQLSKQELEQALFDMGMELEGVQDDDLSVEVTAERLDLLSVPGLARALRSFLGLAQSAPQYEVHTDNLNYVVKITKEVKDVRPFTVCAIVKNLYLDDERIKEIIEVQEKLHLTLGRNRARGAIGIYPLESIKLPITYTATYPKDLSFVPLGESSPMTGADILAFHETGKAYAHLLADKLMYPYFVDAAGEVLSMPPIINSEKTGRVTEQTKDIFIECSGHDLRVLQELLTYLVTFFADIGGEVHAMRLQYEDGKTITTPNLAPLKRSFSTATFKQYVGLSLKQEELQSLLAKMMYTVTSIGQSRDGELIFELLAPPFRQDLWHEVDVVEDIARAYGYNNLELTFPNVSFIGGTLPLSNLREDVVGVLTGMGFLETYTFALTSKQEQLQHMLLDESKVAFMPVANGGETQNMLRISLLPEQLKCLAHNRNQPLPQRIAEGAFVVIPDAKQDVRCRNELHLAALLTNKTVTFTQIKQVLDAVVASRGLSVFVKSCNHPSFIKGRVGLVYLGEIAIGIVGELHPQVLENFGLTSPVAAFEINLERLL